MNLTKARIEEFIQALEGLGGTSGNQSLRQKLGWEDEEFYWKVQGNLISDGRIATGRGKGGSVRLLSQTAPTESLKATINELVTERDLYAPLKDSIQKKWINRFAFDNVLVDETHSRGSKDTGGTFTRPDITAVGIRSYIYLPKRLEVITIEVKPADAVSIMGVLEAIAHRESANRSYVIYATSHAKFDSATEGERILELGQKNGIGIILTEQLDDVESWDIVLDAVRYETDCGDDLVFL